MVVTRTFKEQRVVPQGAYDIKDFYTVNVYDL